MREPPATSAAAADYLAAMAADLAMLARRNGLEALGYLLDMARLEAENATRKTGIKQPGSTRDLHPKFFK